MTQPVHFTSDHQTVPDREAAALATIAAELERITIKLEHLGTARAMSAAQWVSKAGWELRRTV